MRYEPKKKKKKKIRHKELRYLKICKYIWILQYVNIVV